MTTYRANPQTGLGGPLGPLSQRILVAAALVLPLFAVAGNTLAPRGDGRGGGTASAGSQQDLFPGGDPVALAGPPLTVAIEIGWSVQADSAKPPCTAADFELVQPGPRRPDATGGADVAEWDGASIQLLKTSSDQDNCKDVTVPLVYSSNRSNR